MNNHIYNSMSVKTSAETYLTNLRQDINRSSFKKPPQLPILRQAKKRSRDFEDRAAIDLSNLAQAHLGKIWKKDPLLPS